MNDMPYRMKRFTMGYPTAAWESARVGRMRTVANIYFFRNRGDMFRPV